MLKITNLWIRVNTDSLPTDFWYIDYEKGLATRSFEKPKNESIKNGMVLLLNFLKNVE